MLKQTEVSEILHYLHNNFYLNCALTSKALDRAFFRGSSQPREAWVRSLGWEDPLEKEKATHSSSLAWKIPWMDEHGGLQSMGAQSVRHD